MVSQVNGQCNGAAELGLGIVSACRLLSNVVVSWLATRRDEHEEVEKIGDGLVEDVVAGR